jgi:SAM-dependent methyltransferase
MSDFWDREVIEQQHVPWMDVRPVRLYINRTIGHGELLWPLELLERFLNGRTFERGLSIGCGSGALERQLIKRELCRRVDAFDGSVVSLHTARKQAQSEGVAHRIRYFAANFNEPALPRSVYDIVFFHQSAHHVAKLEKLFRAVMTALKPDGLVYLDEYIGPSRHDWKTRPELIAPHRKIFASLPAKLRTVEKLDPPVQEDDPSEAIRSSEIEPQLRVGFDIVGRQPYGGGILSVILPLLRIQQLDDATLDSLIEADRKAPEYYALIAARPKSGIRGAVARARYWFVPKAIGVLRRISSRLRG